MADYTLRHIGADDKSHANSPVPNTQLFHNRPVYRVKEAIEKSL